MASSNYPFNQDTSYNSFVITDNAIVNSFLGATYSQSELVPVSLDKIFKASLTDPTIAQFPLSQFVQITGSEAAGDWDVEGINYFQSGEFKRAYSRLFEYWKNCLITNSWGWTTALKSPMLVATQTDVKFVESSAGGGTFHLQMNFDLVIFVLPNSPYA